MGGSCHTGRLSVIKRTHPTRGQQGIVFVVPYGAREEALAELGEKLLSHAGFAQFRRSSGQLRPVAEPCLTRAGLTLKSRAGQAGVRAQSCGSGKCFFSGSEPFGLDKNS